MFFLWMTIFVRVAIASALSEYLYLHNKNAVCIFIGFYY